MSAAVSLYVVFALLLVWHARRGWRLGPVRLALSIGALVASGAAAWLFADALAPHVALAGDPPQFVRRAIGGLVAGTAAWLVVVLLGGVLFKRTEHQSVGILRGMYGLLGLLGGIAYGLVLCWVLSVGVRLAGAALPPEALRAGGVTPAGSWLSVESLAEGLRAWRDELERGPLAPVVALTDPLPAPVYERASRVGRVLAQPVAMRRFFESPAAREMMSDPGLRAFATDPEVARLAAAREFRALLVYPRLKALADDPAFQAKWRAFDLDAALAFALEKEGATPPAATMP